MQTIKLDDKGSDIIYIAHWLETKTADTYFKILLNKIAWQEESIAIFGKQVKVPRLIAWYGDENANYKYSGVEHTPIPWLPELICLKEKIAKEFDLDFNSVLANLYRTGKEYIGWHSDNESSLGVNPSIASISLGAIRKFKLRSRMNKEKFTINLNHGSLLIMTGTTQHYWQHCLPKMLRISDPRINLTFRKIFTQD